MSILKVARMGNPCLRATNAEVPLKQIKSREFQQLLADMRETMTEYEGIGLAAPQVHHNLQLLIMGGRSGGDEEEGEFPLTTLINPKITVLDKKTMGMWEGCLSVPGLRGYVSRPRKIRVLALDEQGRERVLEFANFQAVVLQHEADHLNGVLFVDRVEPGKLAFNEEYLKYHLPREEK